MHPLGLSAFGPLRRVLVIGSHSDDIEIGCGGTLLTLTRSSPELEVDWLVLAASAERAEEARASAADFLAAAAVSRVEVHGFRDGFLPYVGGEVKELFEDLKGRVDPQLVFTHTRHDLHQDHRLVCELTWNTFRDHVILEYEIPKVDGDLGTPNVFVPLTETIVEDKLTLLERHFPSQAHRHWFDRETFAGLMRLRGLEAVASGRFAEAFTCRKLVLTV
jgi:LmbE family N-acetylglucosaminyl deacetylase